MRLVFSLIPIIVGQLSSISPIIGSQRPPHPQISQLFLSIEPYKCKLMSIVERGRTIEVLPPFTHLGGDMVEIFVIPKSYHHHVIRPLTYLFSFNPSTWRGNSHHLSILHKNAQHRAFLVSHERFLACTAFLLFAISGATAYNPWSIRVFYLNCFVIRGETRYPG